MKMQIFIEKKYKYKWSHTIQTYVFQRSTVYIFSNFGGLPGIHAALVILALGLQLSVQISPCVTLKPGAVSVQNTTCTRYSYYKEGVGSRL